MPKLSQEMIAIVGVGVALAALDVSSTSALRDEIQAVRVEARADRETLRTERRADREALRAEMRADREAFEKQLIRLEKHIVRLTEQQGAQGGMVEGLRHRMSAASSRDRPG